MVKKKEPNTFSVRACETLKSGITGAELYRRIYGKDGTKKDIQVLINRLNPNRSNPGQDITGRIIEVRPELHDMTLADFFGIEKRR